MGARESGVHDDESTSTDVYILKNLEKRMKGCEGKCIQIVITGMTGVGKSTLTNSLTGLNECTVGDSTNEQTVRSKKVAFVVQNNEISVWDTPGFQNSAEDDRYLNDIAINTCFCKGGCDVLLYAINMTQTRCEENFEDFETMCMLSKEFGKAIWKNAVIVLTNANMCIDLFFSNSGRELKKQFSGKLKEWREKLYQYLITKVELSEEVVKTIQIVPAGIANEERLKTDPEGMFWINNLWLSIMLAAKPDVQPILVNVLLYKLFEKTMICGKTLVSFIRKHQSIYTNQAIALNPSTSFTEESMVGLACSFLHLQKYLLKYLPKLDHNLLQSEDPSDDIVLNYWKSISSSVDIVVAGGEGSGKTALINSLFYGKEKIREGHTLEGSTTNVSVSATIKFETIECRVWDSPGVQVPQCLEKIRQNCGMNKIGLFMFCIGIMEKRQDIFQNIELFTQALGEDVWKHTIIVLTFANSNVYDQDLETVIGLYAEMVKEKLAMLNQEVSVAIKIVCSGYHNNHFIPGDPEKTFWAVNLWMNMISVAQTKYQPALIQILNSSISYVSQCESDFKQRLVRLLYDIMKEQKLTLCHI